jgi:hypothetical protein
MSCTPPIPVAITRFSFQLLHATFLPDLKPQPARDNRPTAFPSFLLPVPFRDISERVTAPVKRQAQAACGPL